MKRASRLARVYDAVQAGGATPYRQPRLINKLLKTTPCKVPIGVAFLFTAVRLRTPFLVDG